MADYAEEIKARLGIYEVVSQYVQLKRAGHNYKGLCPFHSEKTPSFVVSPDKQICHCFGCNKGGDIFTFVQELENISFGEAMEMLADQAGVKIEKKKVKEQVVDKSVKDPYFQAHELATSFFEEHLHGSEDGKKVLDYLHRRGLDDKTIRDFRLGFAPDAYDLLNPYLLSKGIEKDVLLKSGLAATKTIGEDRVYDKYRARLIFPIFDQLGKVCAFGGRTLKQEQMPKYLNSADNPIYNKSRVLYGFYHAKQDIKKEGKVILVEGYFDVLLPYQAGVRNIVATSGTALTEDQVRILKRVTKEAVTCFDADDAGFEATKRAYFLLSNQDIGVKTVAEFEGKDPADFVRSKGVAFADVVNKADDFILVFVNKLLKVNDSKTLDGRRKILGEALPVYKNISPAVRDFFIRDLSGKLGVKEQFIYDEISNYKLPVSHPARMQGESIKKSRIGVEEIIIGLFLEFPVIFRADLKDIFSGTWLQIYEILLSQHSASEGNVKVWNYEEGGLLPMKGELDVLRLYIEEFYRDFTEKTLPAELQKLIDNSLKERRIKQLDDIHQQIENAEASGDLDSLKRLLQEQQALMTKIQS